ncbi:MAG: SVM family protein [Candidatus Phytoplasma sp. TWB_XP]
MFKFKQKSYLFTLFLFIFLGLFLITNNLVMGAPKKDRNKEKNKDKTIIDSETYKKTKKEIQQYRALEQALNDVSEEESNKILEMLSDPKKIELLKKQIEEQKGSSSQQPDNSKK